MPTHTSYFSKHRIFLFYWALIIALGGYLAYDYCTDYYEEMEQVLVYTVNAGTRSAERYNQFKLSDVHYLADDYNIPQNEDSRQKAKLVDEQIGHCQKQISHFKGEIRLKDFGGQHELVAMLNQLGDSLLLLTNHDSSITADLQTLIFQPAVDLQTPKMASFFKNVPLSKVNLYLEDLVWKMELANCSVLHFLQSRMQFEKVALDYMPIFEANDYPKAGKPFTGEVYLTQYICDSENLKFFINGNEYPSKNGIVEYTRTYPKPGTYHNRVEIKITTAATGKTRSYNNGFQEVKVLKP